MPKPGKLTIKQAKFVKAYISNGGNGTQAIMQSYNVEEPRTATAMSVENLSKPSVQQAVEQALAKSGITLDLITDEIKSLATTQVDKVSGDTKLKSLETLLKLHNAFPGSKHTNLNLNIKGKMRDLSFQDAKKELEKLNAQVGELVNDPTEAA